MRRALLALLLAACGSDADPHELVMCEGWTTNDGSPITGQCEIACQMPPQSTGNTCDTVVQLNCGSFRFDNVEGCCIPAQTGTPIRFVECQ